ncbi:hypothetical protein MGYG_05855 [Nannizzia gypsea CBS 118893]|uniref:Uncharacterized protein n=1 Tax=Arthroderma gypseum (strain ATCC MYA-4604 / CBS 118893) TaxID=535722 RepID=E4UZR7_ARTGP|nr:hypothetical protein MGYG_05855 [Nannizzia gypsea CBS 118893]EFR02854.1 hypothetical protein MGYG_05855 [Nannizzia gypsea CBS 118893]
MVAADEVSIATCVGASFVSAIETSGPSLRSFDSNRSRQVLSSLNRRFARGDGLKETLRTCKISQYSVRATLLFALSTLVRSILSLLDTRLSTFGTKIGAYGSLNYRIPDLADPDPLRYAILACIAEALVLALNWRLSLSMRRNGNHIHHQHGSDPYPPYNPLLMPSWTRDVPAVPTSYLRLTMPESKLDFEGRLVLIDEGKSEIFRKRNIIASEYRFYTI